MLVHIVPNQCYNEFRLNYFSTSPGLPGFLLQHKDLQCRTASCSKHLSVWTSGEPPALTQNLLSRWWRSCVDDGWCFTCWLLQKCFVKFFFVKSKKCFQDFLIKYKKMNFWSGETSLMCESIVHYSFSHSLSCDFLIRNSPLTFSPLLMMFSEQEHSLPHKWAFLIRILQFTKSVHVFITESCRFLTRFDSVVQCISVSNQIIWNISRLKLITHCQWLQ